MKNSISVKAKLCLLPTSEGGRSNPIFGPGSYRPNHNFGKIGNRFMYIGFIEISKEFYLKPGECAEVRVDFLKRWPELVKKLTLGRKWYIQEGAKVVGIATVLEILDDI